MRVPDPARRGQRPWHMRTLLVREPGDLACGRRGSDGPHREGEEPKPMRYGGEKSDFAPGPGSQTEGTVHRALPPSRPRHAADGVLRSQAGGRPRLGWADMAGLCSRPRPSNQGPACTGPTGSVPGAAESGWQPAPGRGGRPRGEDRPEGDGRRAERDLRGGVPRVLVRGSGPSAANTMRWMRSWSGSAAER